MNAIKRWCRRNWPILAVVLLPTLLASAYYYLVASDQYESEAHFVIRSVQTPAPQASGVASLLMMGGASGQSKNDAMSVVDYLESMDAALLLDQKIGLSSRFQRNDIDWLSRMKSDPKPEDLLKYYRKKALLKYKDESGITTLKVRAFHPQDALLIANAMLAMGERQVNELNRRSSRDTLATADRQLAEAEAGLREAQVEMTRFRSTSADFDPEVSGRAQTGMVTDMTASLSVARAQLRSMQGIIDANSPQYIALSARVRALEAQLGTQQGRLAGEGRSIATKLGDYESLQVRQQFAAKRYDIAAAAYQAAREEARKKQLYLVRVVNPNVPEKSLYPERGRIVLTVLVSLFLAYAIGWLILAGVKEHANG